MIHQQIRQFSFCTLFLGGRWLPAWEKLIAFAFLLRFYPLHARGICLVAIGSWNSVDT